MMLTCRQCGRGYGGSQASGGHCTGETSRAYSLWPAEASTHSDPSLTQTPVDDGWITPDKRGYRVRSHPSGVQSSGEREPFLCAMFARMVGSAQRHQVLWSVVGAVPVQVVNVLSVSDDSVEHPMFVGFDVLELPDAPPNNDVPLRVAVPPGRKIRYMLAGGQTSNMIPTAFPFTSKAIAALWRAGNLGAAGSTRFGDDDHAVILLVRSLCHMSFRSQGAFDKHRTRDFTCVDVANTPPWRETATGWTPYPPNTRFPSRQATSTGRTGPPLWDHTGDDPDAGNPVIGPVAP